MNKILLTGFRGSGKSTVGKALAEKLDWKFFDLDEEIERKEKKSISEIVRERGWDYFRAIERLFLEEISRLERVVCALGGGAVLHTEQMNSLKRNSVIIWLKPDLDTIKTRLLSDPKTVSQRPSLTNLDPISEIEKVYAEREPLYKAFADVIVEIKGDQSLESIVEQILVILSEHLNIDLPTFQVEQA